MYIEMEGIKMNSILFILIMMGILTISGIAAIIMDDLYFRKDDYINELEKRVKKK